MYKWDDDWFGVSGTIQTKVTFSFMNIHAKLPTYFE